MITANDLTIAKVAAIPTIELIETRIVQSAGREDFEYEVGSFQRRIIQSSNDVSLTFDNVGVAWGMRWTISKNASTSGDTLNVIWNINITDLDASTGLIPDAQFAADAWNEYLAGNLVEQSQASGIQGSDEVAERDIQEKRERDAAEAEKAEAEAEAEAESKAEAEANAQAELEAQVKDWAVIQETRLTIPSTDDSELFEITGQRPSYSVKLKSGIGKVTALDTDFDIVYQIEERTYLRNYYGGVKKLESQYRVSVIDSPNGKALRIAGATPQFTLSSAQTIYDSGIQTTQQSLNEVQLSGEWIEEEGVTFSWAEVPTTIQEIFEVDNSNVVIDASWSRGAHPESIRFENQGKTMVIVDFDTPSFTLEGIQQKLSGTASFTIAPSKRLNVLYTNEDVITWINLADSQKPEGVTKTGKNFNFTMYGGDRMEIDTDNEYDGRRPFLVQTKGKEWFVSEEPDDTSYLTFSNIERIGYKEYTFKYYLYEGVKYEEQNVTSSFSKNITSETPQYILDQMTDPEMLATMREPSVNAPMVETEKSFISPEDVIPDIDLDLPDNPLDTSNLKWWILGGALLVGGFILLGIFVNGRARRTVSDAI